MLALQLRWLLLLSTQTINTLPSLLSQNTYTGSVAPQQARPIQYISKQTHHWLTTVTSFSIKQHRPTGLVNRDILYNVLKSHYKTSGYSSSIFKIYTVYIPFSHLKCCQKDHLDRKWHCKDFTSHCPTSRSWLITQKTKMTGRFSAAWACGVTALSQHWQMDEEWGDGQTALKMTDFCVDMFTQTTNCSWMWFRVTTQTRRRERGVQTLRIHHRCSHLFTFHHYFIIWC